MHGAYLFFLLLSICCLALIDRRYKLVCFNNKHLAAKVLGISILVFVVWDIAGILLNIFFIGKNSLLLGVHLGNFPVEELFFLVLLNYTALLGSQYLKLQRGLK
jgi:lycopene cyclase domain-containing protein